MFILIAIVAGFKVHVISREITTCNAIAAERCIATVGAIIRVDLVSIITSFNASLNMPITATRRRAIVQAGIGLCLIGIVAGFNALLNNADGRSKHSLFLPVVKGQGC